jgi:hypothetical protein
MRRAEQRRFGQGVRGDADGLTARSLDTPTTRGEGSVGYENVANRVRVGLGDTDGDLIVPVGPERFEDALARPGTRPLDFTGRPMTGWVYVEATSGANKRTVDRWVRSGVEFAQSLPPKAKQARKRPKAGVAGAL